MFVLTRNPSELKSASHAVFKYVIMENLKLLLLALEISIKGTKN